MIIPDMFLYREGDVVSRGVAWVHHPALTLAKRWSGRAPFRGPGPCPLLVANATFRLKGPNYRFLGNLEPGAGSWAEPRIGKWTHYGTGIGPISCWHEWMVLAPCTGCPFPVEEETPYDIMMSLWVLRSGSEHGAQTGHGMVSPRWYVGVHNRLIWVSRGSAKPRVPALIT